MDTRRAVGGNGAPPGVLVLINDRHNEGRGSATAINEATMPPLG